MADGLLLNSADDEVPLFVYSIQKKWLIISLDISGLSQEDHTDFTIIIQFIETNFVFVFSVSWIFRDLLNECEFL